MNRTATFAKAVYEVGNRVDAAFGFAENEDLSGCFVGVVDLLEKLLEFGLLDLKWEEKDFYKIFDYSESYNMPRGQMSSLG